MIIANDNKAKPTRRLIAIDIPRKRFIRRQFSLIRYRRWLDRILAIIRLNIHWSSLSLDRIFPAIL